MKTILAALFIGLVPAVALADDKPDCSDPQTQMDMNFCAGEAYKAADKTLNTTYQAAMKAMKDIDSYLPADQKGAADALLAAQRAWIPFRDKACIAEGYMVEGGSMQPMIEAECQTRLTKERIADLKILIKGMGN